MDINIKISPGEAMDRLTILLLKKELGGVSCQEDIDRLSGQVGDLLSSDLGKKLYATNVSLWLVENKVRENDEHFNLWASSIFSLNEIRANIKVSIDSSYDISNTHGKIYEDRHISD